MQAAPGETRSPFQAQHLLPEGASRFSLECGCELGARRLLNQLSAAGCVLQGFPQRYGLRNEIGRGGFGVVYLAHDTWTGQEVAVKVFHCRGNGMHIPPFREAMLSRWASYPVFPEFKAIYNISDEELEELGLGDELFNETIALVTEYIPGGDLFSSPGPPVGPARDASKGAGALADAPDAVDALGIGRSIPRRPLGRQWPKSRARPRAAFGKGTTEDPVSADQGAKRRGGWGGDCSAAQGEDQDGPVAQAAERRASSARSTGRQGCGGSADAPASPVGGPSFRRSWHRVASKSASQAGP
ncbi:unnamed protein product [Prorocentrum cordatum]|nr:unnamed protein product [Polarella glacialis]